MKILAIGCVVIQTFRAFNVFSNTSKSQAIHNKSHQVTGFFYWVCVSECVYGIYKRPFGSFTNFSHHKQFTVLILTDRIHESREAIFTSDQKKEKQSNKTTRKAITKSRNIPVIIVNDNDHKSLHKLTIRACSHTVYF